MTIDSVVIISLLFEYQFWMILGLALIIIDLLIGTDLVLVSFGVAAMITGLAVTETVQSLLGNPLTHWRDILFVYGVLAVISVFLVRKYARRSTPKEDINTY